MFLGVASILKIFPNLSATFKGMIAALRALPGSELDKLSADARRLRTLVLSSADNDKDDRGSSYKIGFLNECMASDSEVLKDFARTHGSTLHSTWRPPRPARH